MPAAIRASPTRARSTCRPHQADLPARDFFIVVPVLDEAERAAVAARRAGAPSACSGGRSSSTTGRPTAVRGSSPPRAVEVLREPRRGYGYPCLTGARAAAARGAQVGRLHGGRRDRRPGAGAPARRSRPRRGGRPRRRRAARRRAARAPPRRRPVRCRRSPAAPDATGRMPLHQRLGNDWLALSACGCSSACASPTTGRSAPCVSTSSSGCAWRSAPTPSPRRCSSRLTCCGARIVVRETRYRPRAGRSKIAGTARGTFGAVRDITWCLVRLRLLGFHVDP